MTIHTLDYYMDGFAATPFCKVCSAEGEQLLMSCTGPIDVHNYFHGLSRKEFEEKYTKALDQSKTTR